MSTRTALNKAYKIVGKVKLGNALGINYQNMNNWHDYNNMPCSEFNGDTKYSMKIEELTGGKVTITDLCGHIPLPQSKGWKGK